MSNRRHQGNGDREETYFCSICLSVCFPIVSFSLLSFLMGGATLVVVILIAVLNQTSAKLLVVQIDSCRARTVRRFDFNGGIGSKDVHGGWYEWIHGQ